MKAIGTTVLVAEEEVDNAVLVVKRNLGKVISVGGENKELFVGDEVLYGESYEEVPLSDSSGKTKTYFLMDIKNIKLVVKTVVQSSVVGKALLGAK
jgi:hypothetical protein